jgi:hypothetical protein
MLLIGLTAFVGLSVWLIPATWQWGTADWGSFSLHAPVLRYVAWELFLHNPAPWLTYWQWITQYDLQTAWALHLAIPLLGAAVAAITLAHRFYVPGGRDVAKHIDGPQLFSGRRARRHARAACRRELTGNAIAGVALHPHVPLPIQRELGNLLVIGQQGSGKSVVLKPLIHQIITRGDRVLIYDEKREYTPLFFKQKSTALLSPPDARSMNWDIANDATTPELARLIADQLIHISEQDSFWSDGARLILTGCICILNARQPRRWGWPDLRDTLVLPEAELLAGFIAHYPRAARLVKEQSKTTDGFLMTIAARLDWIDTLATAWPDRRQQPFSIRRWLTDETAPKVIIVPNDPRYAAVSGPLCNALLSLMTAHSLALPDSDSRRIWFALDELGNLPTCSALLKWLPLGRSKGARTLAGFQSLSQLKELYGEHGAETLLSLFATVIALRCGAVGGSAQAAAEAFGKRIVERPVVTLGHDGKRSTTYQRSDPEPVIRPDDLVQLPQANKRGVQGFLSVAGWQAVYRLVWPYPKLPQVAAPYLPAAWLRPTAAPTPPNRRNRRRT